MSVDLYVELDEGEPRLSEQSERLAVGCTGWTPTSSAIQVLAETIGYMCEHVEWGEAQASILGTLTSERAAPWRPREPSNSSSISDQEFFPPEGREDRGLRRLGENVEHPVQQMTWEGLRGGLGFGAYEEVPYQPSTSSPGLWQTDKTLPLQTM